ncbi:MAG: tetratricopeptide repeat protein [Candidatus Competibacteraceae bacterium]|nr:tetratricopeptide repeat protein [Candidatus Competibacteraceae bacterium]
MVEGLREQAERFAADGQLAQARDLYARVCQLAPHRATHWLRLAQLRYDMHQAGDCLQALQCALRLEPQNPTALLLASAASLELGHYLQALQLAEQVAQMKGGNRLAALLNQANALLRLERCAEAFEVAEAALSLDQDHPVAHSTRGSALLGLGRYEEALTAFQRSLALRPGHAPALLNQALVLRAMQRPADALAAVDAALAVEPDSPVALLNRAAILLDLAQPQDALAALDRLLARQPQHFKALLNRALALLQLGRYAEAQSVVQSLRAAGQPVAGILLTAAEALLRQNQTTPASVWIEQGLSWYPDQPELLRGKIAILLAQERYRPAVAAAERLLAVASPEQADERLAAAAAFNANGRFQEALALLDALPPAMIGENWEFHAKRGEALAGLDRFAEARASFSAADRLASRTFRANYHDGPFHSRPVDSPPPPVTPELVRINYEFRRLEHGDWQDYESRIAAVERWTAASLARGEPSPLLPFRALFLPLPDELRLAIARSEARRSAQTVTALAAADGPSLDPLLGQGARLKVGYVSADFREHPTAHLMRGLFRCHDRDRFEIYVYSLREDDGSAYYRQIHDDCEHFIDLSKLDNGAAGRRIRADGIQILVDLMTYTNHARPELFALRPAPLQMGWLGFPGTSGADYLDYLLVDPVVLPPEQTQFCTERPVWLPECYQVNDRWQDIAETGVRRADQGLPESGFVFCCFNQVQKIEPLMFGLWMRVLQQVPGSVLWLYSESEEVHERLRANAGSHGVAGERLIFAGRLPKARHLERHRLADLFLDTRLYNAHTTASDALWAGLPVLTCPGEAFPARVAASLLRAVGLPELIAASLRDYEAHAVGLAHDPAQLQRLRETLWRNRLRAPLFDTDRFARHLESAYRSIWERHAGGLPPAPLRVRPLPPVGG